MNDASALFQSTTWEHVLLVIAVFLAARLLTAAMRRTLRFAAENSSPHLRLSILRAIPLLRLLIAALAVLIAIPILIEPTLRNVFTLVLALGLAVAFTLKDFGSSVAAGLAVILENTYQPGDWIELDGVYGEVRSINLRAVRIVTADDTEVVIPHLRIWSKSVHNATSGSHSLLCVANFYLHPDHDGTAVRQRLAEIAQAHPQRVPESKVSVIAQEEPWGTRYKLKAYVKESRDQFLFITELTLAAKEALRALGVTFSVVPYAKLDGKA